MRSATAFFFSALACGAFAKSRQEDDTLALVQTKADVMMEERASSERAENTIETVDRALQNKGDPPPPPPPPPTPYPTPPPTPPPTPSPTPAPTTTTTTTTAGVVELDLKGKLTQSNLGGQGPDSGSAEVRYSSVANINGVGEVDLVVTSDRTEAFETHLNGNKNGFGRLSQASGQSYDYTFTIENADGPVTLGNFAISFFDVDANVHQEIKETITVCGASAIMLTSSSRLSAAADGECTTVTPAMLSASPNVKSLDGLSETQTSHAFSATFQQTSRFTVRTSISESSKKVENRALVFAGALIEGAQPLNEEEGAKPSCDQVSIEGFAGKKFEVTQKSTLWGQDTYTYVIEIGGEITQSTGSRVYKIGQHDSYGDKTESFKNGEKCGNTPREATIKYTFGSDMRLLSANEPSMCVYEYEIQLPESDCAVVR
jgi:hypothetical protein